MTTVIVVVVVALVFFVALCTVTFMVWKREEEMRTDSLRSIESNLQELGYRLSDDFGRNDRSLRAPLTNGSGSANRRGEKVRMLDPFEWVRDKDDVFDSAADNEAGACEPAAPAEDPVTDYPQYEGDYSQRTEGFEDEYQSDIWEGDETAAAEYPPLHIAGDDDDAEASDLEEHVPEPAETAEYSEISLDGIDFEDIELPEEDDDIINVDDFAMLEDLDDIDGYVLDYAADNMSSPPSGSRYDVGLSGRKYTAEELDMLIKE